MLCSAGLRGGVALSLALTVANNKAYDPLFRREFVNQVVGSVLLTSIINGLTAKPLYQLLHFPTFKPSATIFSRTFNELQQ